jgi:hypothetical protein
LLPAGRLVQIPAAEVSLPAEAPVAKVTDQFLAQVAKDPDVQDWLISASEHDQTRGEYLEHLARFLAWAGWTPGQLWDLKREAMKRGEPLSEVEKRLRRYHEALRRMGYAGKTRAKLVAAVYSFIGSKGYPIPRKLIRLDMADKLMMRVPEREEIETFLHYARTPEKKLYYTMTTDCPCRPRVFPALRWSWLEEKWMNLPVIHIPLPKEFRPQTQGGPRKFEPPCFLGPRSVSLLKQVHEAKVLAGKPPKDTDHILPYTQDAWQITVARDFNYLTRQGLIRPSRTDEQGELIEQPITPKSWRKYQFNIIDAIPDISPEWRKMLKGRDLQTERYYSKENIEALRKIYREKIYPQLWTDTTALSAEKMKSLEEKIETLTQKVQILEEISHTTVEITP